MTEQQKAAIGVLIDLASRWLENAEEGLPARISPEMLDNDALWANVVGEMADGYEREDAEDCRRGLRAIHLVQALLVKGE